MITVYFFSLEDREHSDLSLLGSPGNIKKHNCFFTTSAFKLYRCLHNDKELCLNILNRN